MPKHTTKFSGDKPPKRGFLSYLNPFNFGVTDRSDAGSFNQAFNAARGKGEEEFIFGNERFNTIQKGEFPNKETEAYFNTIKGQINNEQYGALLDIYHSRGTPRIINNPEEGRDNFNMLTGETNLHGEPSTDALINELTHSRIGKAQNFKEAFTYPFTDGPSQASSTFFNNLFKDVADEDLTYSQERLLNYSPYNIEGTIEHTAHSIVRPKLQEQLEQSDVQKFNREEEVFDRFTNAIHDAFKEDGRSFDKGSSLIFKERDYKSRQALANQYYSEPELLSFDANQFDTSRLQKELINRGFSLPNSTKEDGTVDGILGDETRNALLEYRKYIKAINSF